MYTSAMRTTISLDADTAAAIEELRRRTGAGLSEAVNELIRKGLTSKSRPPAFRQKSHPMDALIDVANVAEALELLEGPLYR
jgi:metal-responsive CopG/Arc/MetJ family transcriptional regulator